jgi:outer membrane lipoprotein-sorting protein
MRCITLLAVALVAAPAYGQENEAERLYRAMEKKIRSAKTVHFAFDGQISAKLKATMKGEAWLAEGEKGKFTFALEGDSSGQNLKMTQISDGKWEYTKGNEQVNVKAKKPEEKKLEKAFGMIARVGMVMAWVTGIDPFTSSPSKEPFDLDKRTAIKDFKLGAKEKIGKHNTQAVDYQVSLAGGRGATAKATVWIDSETKLPVKREFVLQKDGADQGSVSETYSTFTVNGKIDAKVFEVPK